MKTEHHSIKIMEGVSVTLELPDGREVLVTFSDIDDGALPELEITLPAPMVANCWLANMAPGRRVTPNALECLQIDIPIELPE